MTDIRKRIQKIFDKIYRYNGHIMDVGPNTGNITITLLNELYAYVTDNGRIVTIKQ